MDERGPRRAAVSLVVAACVAVTGCGASQAKAKILEGPVTTVNQHTICVGGPAASGECFGVDSVTRSLRVDDCVRVTYTPDDSAAPATATGVEQLDAATHAGACPEQLASP